MKLQERLFRGLRMLLYGVSVTGLGLMLVLIFMQVVNRYIFGFVFPWTEELARFLFVWVVFIGGALIMGEGGHMAVKMLPECLKGTRTGALLNVLISAIGIVFIGILIYQGCRMSRMMMFQTSPGLGIPMGVVYSIIPVSGVLMLLYALKDVMAAVRIMRSLNDSRDDKE